MSVEIVCFVGHFIRLPVQEKRALNCLKLYCLAHIFSQRALLSSNFWNKIITLSIYNAFPWEASEMFWSENVTRSSGKFFLEDSGEEVKLWRFYFFSQNASKKIILMLLFPSKLQLLMQLCVFCLQKKFQSCKKQVILYCSMTRFVLNEKIPLWVIAGLKKYVKFRT